MNAFHAPLVPMLQQMVPQRAHFVQLTLCLLNGWVTHQTSVAHAETARGPSQTGARPVLASVQISDGRHTPLQSASRAERCTDTPQAHHIPTFGSRQEKSTA